MSQFVFNLVDIVNISKLEKVLSAYTKATHMSSLITDSRGHPISTENFFHPICQAIREDPELRQRCIKCDALGGLEASSKGETHIYKCHAGLVDVCCLIVLDGTPIANLFTGQMLITEDDEDKVPYITDVHTDLTAHPILNLLYQDHLKSAPRLSYEQILSYTTLIQEIANYIAKLSYEKIFQEKIQAQEKKLLERKNMQLKSKLKVNQYNSLFLIEAFNTIYNQAILENATATSDLLYSFSTILKRNISSDTQYITLEKELEDIQNSLMDLYNATFDHQIELVLDVAANLLHELVPITSIQPILMNVFFESLAVINSKVSVHISIKKSNDILYISLYCPQVHFPDVNFNSREDLQEQEVFFSKASLFTMKLVAYHLNDFYASNFEMYTQDNHFYLQLPSVFNNDGIKILM